MGSSLAPRSYRAYIVWDVPRIFAISDCMFAFCDALESVEIPDSVTIIGNCAFFGSGG